MEGSLKIVNGSLTNGRFEIPYDELVSARVICSSSGSQSPFVKIRVSWGDDVVDTVEAAVGQTVQLEHTYESPGDYNLSAVAVNAEGLRSQTQAVALRVALQAQKKKDLVRWRGLALPRSTLDISSQSVESESAPISYTVAVNAYEGDQEIFVYADSVSSLVGAEYTLSQVGKLYSSGRIIEADANRLILDTGLSDDYDQNQATIEVYRRSLIPGISKVRTTDFRWLFEPATDDELVKSSFIVNLSTRKGERVMLPEFGSNLHLVPFEQNDLVTRQLMKLEVIDPIAQWEPRAEITGVRFSVSDNEMSMDIAYRYAGGAPDNTFTALIPLRASE